MKELKKFTTIIAGSILGFIGALLKLEGKAAYGYFLSAGVILTVIFFVMLFSGKIRIGGSKQS